MIRLVILAALLLPAVGIAPRRPPSTYEDRSGTITAGGTAQVVLPAWNGRHGCVIQNQSAGSLWVSETAARDRGAAVDPDPRRSAVPLHVAGVRPGLQYNRRDHGAGLRGSSVVKLRRRSLLLAGAALPASAFGQCVTDTPAVDACLGGVRLTAPPGVTFDQSFLGGSLGPGAVFTRASDGHVFRQRGRAAISGDRRATFRLRSGDVAD